MNRQQAGSSVSWYRC